MDAALEFYKNLTTLSFTLLGLWFVVLQFSDRWRTDPNQYRTILHVALHFFLPGMMGLGSVLAGSNGVIWRITFSIFGLIGFVESLQFCRSPFYPSTRMVKALRVLDPILYALVVVAVFNTATVFALTPLQVEGIVTGLVFMTGMAYLWATFAGPALHLPTPPVPAPGQVAPMPVPGRPPGPPPEPPTQDVTPMGAPGPAAPPPVPPPWMQHPSSGPRPPER